MSANDTGCDGCTTGRLLNETYSRMSATHRTESVLLISEVSSFQGESYTGILHRPLQCPVIVSQFEGVLITADSPHLSSLFCAPGCPDDEG